MPVLAKHFAWYFYKLSSLPETHLTDCVNRSQHSSGSRGQVDVLDACNTCFWGYLLERCAEEPTTSFCVNRICACNIGPTFWILLWISLQERVHMYKVDPRYNFSASHPTAIKIKVQPHPTWLWCGPLMSKLNFLRLIVASKIFLQLNLLVTKQCFSYRAWGQFMHRCARSLDLDLMSFKSLSDW